MTLIDDLHAAWNTHDPKGVAACYAEDGVREEFLITHARVQGRDGVAAQVQLYLHAIPDATLDFRNVYSTGGEVTTIEWTFSGIHTGDAEGWPARGEHVVLPGVTIIEVTNGQVSYERVYADFAILLAGAGLIPGVEPPTFS
jgi:steroid delta-isomerase-like uncharacterized protein